MRIAIPLPLSVALLAACATPYVPQTGGPTAMVRFTSNVGDSFDFFTTDIARCPAVPRESLGGIGALNPGEISTLKMFGSSPAREGRIIERVINADRPLPVLAHSWRDAAPFAPGYRCTVGLTFTPKAGRQYEVNYTYNPPRCSVQVVELVGKSNTEFDRVPEPSVTAAQARQLRDFCTRK